MDKSKLQNLINSKKVSENIVAEKAVAIKSEKVVAGKLKELSGKLNLVKQNGNDFQNKSIRLYGMNKAIFDLYEEINDTKIDNAIMSNFLSFMFAAEMLATENKQIERSLAKLRKEVLPHIRKL